MEASKQKIFNNRIAPFKKYIVILLVALIAITTAFSWYVGTLKETVYETQITNMQELAEHDISTIQNFIDNQWTDLKNISSKTAIKNIKSDSEIHKLLREEQVLSQFDDIYLVDDKNNLYDTTGILEADVDILNRDFLHKENVLTTNDVLKDSTVGEDEILLVGVKLNGITVNNHKMVEAIGRLDLQKIQDQIRISNYNGLGYSSVFDESGTMIIGINAQGQRLTNYYNFLTKSTDLGKDATEQIKKKLKKNKSFTETFVEKYTKKTYVATFQSIGDSGWYFIMSVPKSVFDDQNSKLLTLVFTMVAIVIASIVLMLFMIFRYQIVSAKRLEREKQKAALASAQYQADHDELTGLLSRRGFMNEVDKRLEELPNTPMTAVFIDFDDFKTINDVYGHNVGDVALADLAQFLTDFFPDNSVVGRTGGDEFSVFIIDRTPEVAADLIERAVAAEHSFEMDGKVYNYKITAGYADCPTQASERSELMILADEALYAAKIAGKHISMKYSEEMSDIKRSHLGFSAKSFVTGIPGALLVYQAKGEEIILFANRDAFDLFGCDDFEDFLKLTGGSFKGLVHPDDQDRVQSMIWSQINKTKENENHTVNLDDYVEYRIVTKDNQVKEVIDYGRLVDDENYGEVFFVFIKEKH